MRASSGLLGVVVLLLVSCSVSLERAGTGTPAPIETAKVGEGLLETLPSPTPKLQASAQRQPLFVLRLDDQNDAHPEGIPVLIEGGQSRTELSDAKGELEIFDPGVYKLTVVEGCHPALQVLGGGYATVGVSPGETKGGSLPVIWQHRFAPTGPIVANVAGDWRVGSPVDLRFDVVDRCADNARAPGSPFPAYEFRPGPTLEVVGEPALVADGEGRGHLTIRCKAEGEAQLLARDSKNPSDSLDLVGATVGFGTRPRCVS